MMKIMNKYKSFLNKKIFFVICMMAAHSTAIAGIFTFLRRQSGSEIFFKMEAAQLYSGAAALAVGACLKETSYQASGELPFKIGGAAFAGVVVPCALALLSMKCFPRTEDQKKYDLYSDNAQFVGKTVMHAGWLLSFPVGYYAFKKLWV